MKVGVPPKILTSLFMNIGIGEWRVVVAVEEGIESEEGKGLVGWLFRLSSCERTAKYVLSHDCRSQYKARTRGDVNWLARFGDAVNVSLNRTMSVADLLDNADPAMINIFEYVKEKTIDIPSLCGDGEAISLQICK